MATMKAAILSAHRKGLKLSEIPIPVPTNGEITIKVLAFYLLDYTKAIIEGTRNDTLPIPLTLGGSCIGRVHAIGPDTTAFEAGQLVFCDPKIRARDNDSNQILLGIREGLTEGSKKLMRDTWRHGCMAEFVKMPLENVYALDEDLLLRSGAFELTNLPMLSTVMTPFGGLNDAGVKVGDTVIVAPATGKFGSAAVMVALAMGAKVVALGRNEEKLNALKKSFPDSRLLTMKLESDEGKDTIALKELLNSKPVDVYIDFSPDAAAAGGKTPTHIGTCIHVLKRGGIVSFTGGIWGKIEIPYSELVLRNISIKGKFTYERDQIKQVIKMAEAGNFDLMKRADLKVIRYPLDQIEEAIETASKYPGLGTSVCVTP